MSFLSRLKLTDSETWPTVEAAANRRYWDGLALATASDNHHTGAIYLMGYMAEMLLKTACCRVLAVSPLIEIRPTAKKGSLSFGSHATQVSWTGSNFHDLVGLTDALLRARQTVNKPMNAVIAGEVLRRVALLATHWSEQLRYQAALATDAEMHEVFEQVEWLHDNYESLWR